MSTYALLSISAIVLLIGASAFFSGSETALTAVSRGLMHRLEHNGVRPARDVNNLVADREKLIGALLLGNTFVNILASSLATAVLESAFGPRAVVVATFVMTIVILVFSEVLRRLIPGDWCNETWNAWLIDGEHEASWLEHAAHFRQHPVQPIRMVKR